VEALVTDAHRRHAVAGVRALGRAGVQTAVLAEGRVAPGMLSRYAAERATGPDADRDRAGFVAAVSALGRRRGPLVVYPCHEPSIDALLDAADRLDSNVRLPYPGRRALDILRDKGALAAAARSVGIASPPTLLEGRAADLRGGPLPDSACVVKPARTKDEFPSRVAGSASELAAVLEQAADDESLLVQELLNPPLVGLAVVIDRDGTLAAAFQQRALRTWPARAGGSSLAVGAEPDMALAERAAALLGGVGYWGLAQLQFLQGPEGPALIDVNTRFYGSLPLATASGVNLPAAWHAIVTGAEPRPRVALYRAGVTYRWLEADLTAAFGGDRRVLLARASRPRAGAMWAGDDPLPSLALTAGAAWARIRRRLPPRP
jgi:predicted ATP-grasp superfamily ATP-dependent carboligase